MVIAVTTPTGHIGGQAASRLLGAGAKVVLLARDSSKLKDLTARGAEVRAGSLDDGDFVAEATRGIDALFWVTPPAMNASDLLAFQIIVGRSAARAIRENGIGRVVNLSSIGGHLSAGAGPVSGLHDVEQLINEAAASVTHLRPGYFFENYMMQLEPIGHDSCVYLPLPGTSRLPMVATRDIAEVAVQQLLDDSWTDWNIRGIHGPADLSFDEAAAQISHGLGRTVRHVRVSENDTRKAMRAMGVSDSAIEALLEMYRAAESGLLRPAEPRTEQTTTPTTLNWFARNVMLPKVAEPVAAGR